MNESTVIGYVREDDVNGFFMESVLDLLVADQGRGASRQRIAGMAGVVAGHRLASARNDVVRQFLATDAQWLLMVDTDMIFSPKDVDLLFEEAHPRERPIVGGLCFGGGRSGVMFPTLYILQQPTEENPDPIHIVKDYPEDALCKVDATGAAFVLIHRRVFEEMAQAYPDHPYPWFHEGAVYRGMQFSEDWAFFMRAKELHIPLYVHTGCNIGHVKSQILDKHAWKDYHQLESEIGEEGIKAAYRARVNQ